MCRPENGLASDLDIFGSLRFCFIPTPEFWLLYSVLPHQHHFFAFHVRARNEAIKIDAC